MWDLSSPLCKQIQGRNGTEDRGVEAVYEEGEAWLLRDKALSLMALVPIFWEVF